MQQCECGCCGKEYPDEEMLSPEEVWRWNSRQVFQRFASWIIIPGWPAPEARFRHGYADQGSTSMEKFQEECRATPGFKEPHNPDEWLVVFRECADRYVGGLE